MDHVLFVDEVAGALDEAEELADVRRPRRERLFRAHLWREDDEPRRAVDFREQRPFGHERGEVLLALVWGEAEELRQANHADALGQGGGKQQKEKKKRERERVGGGGGCSREQTRRVE